MAVFLTNCFIIIVGEVDYKLITDAYLELQLIPSFELSKSRYRSRNVEVTLLNSNLKSFIDFDLFFVWNKLVSTLTYVALFFKYVSKNKLKSKRIKNYSSLLNNILISPKKLSISQNKLFQITQHENLSKKKF